MAITHWHTSCSCDVHCFGLLFMLDIGPDRGRSQSDCQARPSLQHKWFHWRRRILIRYVIGRKPQRISISSRTWQCFRPHRTMTSLTRLAVSPNVKTLRSRDCADAPFTHPKRPFQARSHVWNRIKQFNVTPSSPGRKPSMHRHNAMRSTMAVGSTRSGHHDWPLAAQHQLTSAVERQSGAHRNKRSPIPRQAGP
jgi:hypothetical protein